MMVINVRMHKVREHDGFAEYESTNEGPIPIQEPFSLDLRYIEGSAPDDIYLQVNNHVEKIVFPK